MEICIDEFSPESTDELNHEYEIIERIGSGAFGTVMHAVETSTNRECAIKVINKSGKKQSSIQKMKQEIPKHKMNKARSKHEAEALVCFLLEYFFLAMKEFFQVQSDNSFLDAQYF